MPKHEELNEVLMFQASELKKYFKMGDHVKVLAGKVFIYFDCLFYCYYYFFGF